jgi:thioredoxin-related protein
MKKVQLIIIGFLLAFIINFNSLDVIGQEKIKWYTMEEVQKLSQENPKKVFIDVYTDWCGWCKRMDATTFKDPKIVKILNENFYAVKLDGEGQEVIVFKDKEYKFVPQGRKGYHELAAALMNGRLSYPTTVYLDENLNMIQPIPGYMKVEDLEPILIFLGKDHYKNQTWKDFLAQNYSNN